MGSFVKHTRDACSCHGELLHLMAIHLILLAVNKCNPDLQDSVQIFSNCLGTLNMMVNLPPYHIPSKCSHSDILKNIMVYCSDLFFHSTPMLRHTRTITFSIGTSHTRHSLIGRWTTMPRRQSGRWVWLTRISHNNFLLNRSAYF
jgi:hypothetical protein